MRLVTKTQYKHPGAVTPSEVKAAEAKAKRLARKAEEPPADEQTRTKLRIVRMARAS